MDVVNVYYYVVASVDHFSIQLEHVNRPCNNIKTIAIRLESEK